MAEPVTARAEHGFSIVEVLVAAFVLAVGVLTTTVVFASSDSTTLDSELQQIATAKAESTIEQLRSIPYNDIGHTATPAEPAGENRISTSAGGRLQFTAPDSSAEDLVLSANADPGDPSPGAGGYKPAAGTSIGQQAQAFTVDPGGGAATVNGNIYTFVTWRDEECEVIPATTLAPVLAGLRSELVARRATVDALLTDLQSTTNGVLPGSAQQLRNSLLATLRTSLDTAISRLDTTAATITDIDLCDLSQSALTALTGIVTGTTSAAGSSPPFSPSLQIKANIQAAFVGVNATLSAQLNGASGVQGALDSFQALLGGLTSLVCPNPLLVPLCNAFTTLQNRATTLVNSLTGSGSGNLQTLLDTTSTNIQTLNTFLASPNTTHNTKRITVGVDIDTGPREDISPQNIVWLSTVVANPSAGLISP